MTDRNKQSAALQAALEPYLEMLVDQRPEFRAFAYLQPRRAAQEIHDFYQNRQSRTAGGQSWYEIFHGVYEVNRFACVISSTCVQVLESTLRSMEGSLRRKYAPRVHRTPELVAA